MLLALTPVQPATQLEPVSSASKAITWIAALAMPASVYARRALPLICAVNAKKGTISMVAHS